MNARIVVGALSLFLSACVSTSFRPAQNLEAQNFPPVPPTAVRVLDSTAKQSFLALGEIEAHISGYPSDRTILRKARERAATIGADAIVFKDGLTMMPGGNDYFQHKKLASVRFMAIRLLPGEGSSQPRP